MSWKRTKISNDEDMGAFLRFPEREGGGWNLPNTKNVLTPSELRQRTERPVVAAGPTAVIGVEPWRCFAMGRRVEPRRKLVPLLREEFFYFDIKVKE